MKTEKINEAFTEQLNQHLGIAYKICRIYFKDDAARQDAMQEMMYQLWRAYPAFEDRSKFSTWMYRVCLNTALTYRKKMNRRSSESLTEAHLEIPESTTDKKDEDLTQLLRAIEQLSPLNKAIILLYLEDLSYDEIASITGLTKSNVSVKLVRIKKELEQLLKHNLN